MAKEPPLVSILIPAFNAEKWIAETIRSALAQIWPNKEIIVVDDGSSDRTVTIAESLGVAVIRQPNSGASAARNRALSHSRGDYIQWLDADDLLSPAKIAAQMREAESLGDRRVLLSGAWGDFFHRSSRAAFRPTGLWEDLTPPEFCLRKFETNGHMQTATWLVSRELTDAAGPWNTRLSMDDDGEYFFRAVRAAKQIRFVREAKVFYRTTSSTSLSNAGRSRSKMESQFLSMQLQIAGLLEMDGSDRARAACRNYLRTWLPMFHPERPDIVQEVRQLAARLGGELEIPRSAMKYAWIEQLFGAHARKQAQLEYNRTKSFILRTWDKVLYSLQGSRRKLEADS